MTMFNADGTFDFNATISVPDNDFVVLEPGNYYFTVDRVEYGTYQSNPSRTKPSTIPDGCRTVEIFMSIETPKGIAQVRDRFFMHQSVAWRIGAVHKCLGLMPEDEQNLQMKWDAMPGRTGVCKIKNSTQNGNTYNNVDRYIYPSKVTSTMNKPSVGIPQPQTTANKYGGLL
jgi:hypothetical protein